MIKKIFIFILFAGCLISSRLSLAIDPLCGYGSLQVDFIQVQTFAQEDDYTLHIHGIIDTPNPGYGYSLSLGKGVDGEMARGKLILNKKRSDLSSAAVITPLKIDNTVKISKVSAGIFIDVVKTFNWGAEYFTAKFNGTNSVCMRAEMYK